MRGTPRSYRIRYAARILRARGLKVGVALVLAVVAGGVLHERLRRSPTARCPFGYDVAATPAQRLAARRAFASTHRGTLSPRARSALEWTLDVTTRDELVAWARASGASCVARGTDLECTHAPTYATLWLGFDEAGHLVALTAFRDDTDAHAATDAYHALVASEDQLGEPATHTERDIARGALLQSSTEWRFSDLWSRATVTNMGRARFVSIYEARSLR